MFAALVASGCGSSSDSKTSTSTPKSTSIAKAATKPTGDITLCIGKDTSGLHTKLMKAFNDLHPGANAKLIELPESADDQRTQLVFLAEETLREPGGILPGQPVTLRLAPVPAAAP